MNDSMGFDVTPKEDVKISKLERAIRQGSLATMIGRLDQVHLLTYMDLETQGDLLSPFIKHYTDLGIASRRISIAMGVTEVTQDNRQIAQDLKSCGIRAPKLVPRDLGADDRANILLQIQKKVTLPTEWILRAEIDELLSLPLPLAQLLNMMENREFDWMPSRGSGQVLLHTTSLVFGADLKTPDLEASATLATRHLKFKGFGAERTTNRKADRMVRISTQSPKRMAYPGGGKTNVNAKVNRAVASEGWSIRQLTPGRFGGPWHAHSYFDIPVVDPTSCWVAAHRSDIPYRPIQKDDTAQIGRVSIEAGGFEPLAETFAWSWQQGPMAQWTQTGDLLWNDRDGDDFVGKRLTGGSSGGPETFDRPIYALTPDGTGYLSVCWARLARFRPAYGYEGGGEASAGKPAPADDGVWSVDFATGTSRLILSLAQGVDCLFDALPDTDVAVLHDGDFSYWFNHVKISPDGTRFTVKLRYKTPNTPFQGVSLTCGLDGSDVRLLARRTSHVIWLDSTSLFWWSMADKDVMTGDDVPMGHAAPVPFAKGAFTKNPHAQLLPNSDGSKLIFDVPYRRTVLLKSLDRVTGDIQPMAQFGGHMPEGGTYRCDLHPVPLPNGNGAIVTSLSSGSRQVYVIEKA